LPIPEEASWFSKSQEIESDGIEQWRRGRIEAVELPASTEITIYAGDRSYLQQFM